mgnify:CR=1 FL=1
MTQLTILHKELYYYNSSKIGDIMSKENKKQVYSMILKLNLVLGIYNLFLFTLGNSIMNLIIGSMNIGVWTFFRDKSFLIYLKNRIIKS